MARTPSKPKSSTPGSARGTGTNTCPEFGVRRETICRFFDPPLPRSTFYDFVEKGRIVPMKGLRGFYLLNESLRRLGLREVPELPHDEEKPSVEDVVRLAFTMIDESLFPEPSWLLTIRELDVKDADHARLLAERHRDSVEALGSAGEKLAYFHGVLDALALSSGVEGG